MKSEEMGRARAVLSSSMLSEGRQEDSAGNGKQEPTEEIKKGKSYPRLKMCSLSSTVLRGWGHTAGWQGQCSP